MTARVAEFLDGNTLEPVQIKTGTLSGTVTRGGTGVRRKIEVFRGSEEVLYTHTFSDPSTGEWSVTVNGGVNDDFRAICLGEGDENDIVYGNLTPIF